MITAFLVSQILAEHDIAMLNHGYGKTGWKKVEKEYSAIGKIS